MMRISCSMFPRRHLLCALITVCVFFAVGLGACTSDEEAAHQAHQAQQQAQIDAYVDEVAANLRPFVQKTLRTLHTSYELRALLSRHRPSLEILPGNAHTLKAFYAARSWQPLFTHDRQLNAAGIAVAQTVFAAASQGLKPEDFHGPAIRSAVAYLEDHRDPPRVAGQFRLLDTDRATLHDWLVTRLHKTGQLPDVNDTLTRIVQDVTHSPIPAVSRVIVKRTEALEAQAQTVSRLELWLADAFLKWVITQRYANLRYVTTEMANAHRWRILVDGTPYQTKQPGSPFSEVRPDASMLHDITGRQVALTLAREYLVQTAVSGAFKQAMEDIAPPFRAYRRLEDAAARYRGIVLAGGWQPLTGPVGLAYGAEGPAVIALKDRLAVEGYFSSNNRSPHFGRALRAALLQYQQTHQLLETTTLSEETLASLNVSALDRLAQIHVTMDHWRHTRIGEDYDDSYFLVNVPDFHVEWWDHGRRIHRMRTVVGSTKTVRGEDGELHTTGRTPLFSDLMQYVVFNPYWNVPASIRPYYQKKIDADPFWLFIHGYEIIPTPEGGTLLRQLPGPDNALGQVKFIFPNDHAVYMHDTNQPGLFNRPTREYSHGCVRVQNALEFAALLLAHDRHESLRTAKKFVQDELKLGTEQWVNLRTPIPVHIEYYTVRVDDEGRANFLSDYYRIDAPLVKKRAAWLRARLAANTTASNRSVDCHLLVDSL